MKTFSQYTNEQALIANFLQFCAEHLQLETLPMIELVDNKHAAQQARSFGGYTPSEQTIRVNIAERHMADVFRTLAHELVHYRQHLDDRLDENSGETGSDIENEANAQAGVIMRLYAKQNEKLFEETEYE